MLKITSFSALVAGLLLAMPMVFSNAEAGRIDVTGLSAKSDRESTDHMLDARISDAFMLVDLCAPDLSGDAGSWCRARHAELSHTDNVSTVTVESRDEAARTSTLAAIPVEAK